jgi:hypothetical protein
MPLAFCGVRIGARRALAGEGVARTLPAGALKKEWRALGLAFFCACKADKRWACAAGVRVRSRYTLCMTGPKVEGGERHRRCCSCVGPGRTRPWGRRVPAVRSSCRHLRILNLSWSSDDHPTRGQAVRRSCGITFEITNSEFRFSQLFS